MFGKRKKNSAFSRLDEKIAASEERTEVLANAKAGPPSSPAQMTDDVSPVPPTRVQQAPEPPSAPSKRKRKRRIREMPASEPTIDYNAYEQELDADALKEKQEQRTTEKRRYIGQRIAVSVLVIGCIYLIFLIYGAINTTYEYSADGKIVPQRMTLKSLVALEEFLVVSNEYQQARSLYEGILKLDYRLAAGIEDPIVIAPEYETMLESVESLTIQLQAREVSSQYAQLHAMLLAWVKSDSAVYCQRMSESISQNNGTYATQALEYRSLMYSDFNLITENILALGQLVDGADTTDIANWSPEGYIRDEVGAISDTATTTTTTKTP